MLDKWCEAETDITHRQARVAVGLAVMGGALVIAGWDNAQWYSMLSDKLFFATPDGRAFSQTSYKLGGGIETNLVTLIKKLLVDHVRVLEFSPATGQVADKFTVGLSPEQRSEALDALLKVEGRQSAKIFTANIAFLAGMGVMNIGYYLGSKEKIKGSTGVGQWAARVIKSVGEVL